MTGRAVLRGLLGIASVGRARGLVGLLLGAPGWTTIPAPTGR